MYPKKISLLKARQMEWMKPGDKQTTIAVVHGEVDGGKLKPPGWSVNSDACRLPGVAVPAVTTSQETRSLPVRITLTHPRIDV